MDHLLAALGCALLAGAASWFVPRLVAVVPEPEPDPEPAPDPDPEPDQVAGSDQEPTPAKEPAPVKELYVDIARARGLAPISVLVGAGLGLGTGAVVGSAWSLVFLLPAVPLGIALSVIDWRTRRLPTWYLAPAYPALVVLVVGVGALTQEWDDLRRAGFGWLVMGGFYFLTNLVSARLVGFGDVRLAGLLGIALGYLGWGQLLVGMYSAFLLFGIPPLVLAAVRRDRSLLRTTMPFGPAMLVGAWLGVLVGHPVAHWYVHSR